MRMKKFLPHRMIKNITKLQATNAVPAGILWAPFLEREIFKMMDRKIPKTLIRLILKWMTNKKTGSLQINFIKGEINSAFINLAISLENNENQV